jgi:hypothetical protein
LSADAAGIGQELAHLKKLDDNKVITKEEKVRLAALQEKKNLINSEFSRYMNELDKTLTD